MVIVTSNDERRLPDAFLRRCIFHRIELNEKLVEAAVESMAGIDSSGFPESRRRHPRRRPPAFLATARSAGAGQETLDRRTAHLAEHPQRAADRCADPGWLPARQSARPRRADQGRRRPRPAALNDAARRERPPRRTRRLPGGLAPERRAGGSVRDRAPAPPLRLFSPASTVPDSGRCSPRCWSRPQRSARLSTACSPPGAPTTTPTGRPMNPRTRDRRQGRRTRDESATDHPSRRLVPRRRRTCGSVCWPSAPRCCCSSPWPGRLWPPRPTGGCKNQGAVCTDRNRQRASQTWTRTCPINRRTILDLAHRRLAPAAIRVPNRLGPCYRWRCSAYSRSPWRWLCAGATASEFPAHHRQASGIPRLRLATAAATGARRRRADRRARAPPARLEHRTLRRRRSDAPPRSAPDRRAERPRRRLHAFLLPARGLRARHLVLARSPSRVADAKEIAAQLGATLRAAGLECPAGFLYRRAAAYRLARAARLSAARRGGPGPPGAGGDLPGRCELAPPARTSTASRRDAATARRLAALAATLHSWTARRAAISSPRCSPRADLRLEVVALPQLPDWLGAVDKPAVPAATAEDAPAGSRFASGRPSSRSAAARPTRRRAQTLRAALALPASAWGVDAGPRRRRPSPKTAAG
jgi:hypothetical protein